MCCAWCCAVQKTLRRTFSLSGVAPGSPTAGSPMVRVLRVGWAGLAGPFGCGRPGDRQRQAPAAQVVRECGGAPDPVHRQSTHSEILQVLFLGGC